MKYKHTQIGKVGIGIIVLAAIISIMSVTTEDFSKYAPNWMDTSTWNVWGIAIIIVVYVIVLNMSILTVQIDKESLCWYFGVGKSKKSIQLDDIHSVKLVRNKWWFGFGVRKLLSGGTLYNVHGLDAVEVTTKQGQIVRIGSDDTRKLARTLTTAIDKLQGEDDG